MTKRLLTVAFALALGALATSAQARPYVDDDDDDRPRHSRRHQIRDDDGDDSERVMHRPRHHLQAHASQQHGTLRTGPSAKQHAQRPALAKHSVAASATRGAGTLHDCLSAPTRALLGRIEAVFGPMQIISTCRAGARIAGSGRPSKHASGQAIDFNAGRRKAEVVRWLIANHKSGGTMTYADMSHIHVDIGSHFVALNSASGR
jgi:hypothetical protein